ncbi:MAG: NUDIX domain-containing protein [Candidatus Saccharimonadales bacterium]
MGHIHEKYDFVITLFVVHDGHVLFAHHPRYSKWVPVGGHVELEEDPEQALLREIEEETGLEVEILSDKPEFEPDAGTKLLHRPNYMDVYEANPPHKHVALIYFARAKSAVFSKSDEHLELRWIKEKELEEPEYGLTPSLKFYAVKAIEAERAAVSTNEKKHPFQH